MFSGLNLPNFHLVGAMFHWRSSIPSVSCLPFTIGTWFSASAASHSLITKNTTNSEREAATQNHIRMHWIIEELSGLSTDRVRASPSPRACSRCRPRWPPGSRWCCGRSWGTFRAAGSLSWCCRCSSSDPLAWQSPEMVDQCNVNVKLSELHVVSLRRDSLVSKFL